MKFCLLGILNMFSKHPANIKMRYKMGSKFSLILFAQAQYLHPLPPLLQTHFIRYVRIDRIPTGVYQVTNIQLSKQLNVTFPWPNTHHTYFSASELTDWSTMWKLSNTRANNAFQFKLIQFINVILLKDGEALSRFIDSESLLLTDHTTACTGYNLFVWFITHQKTIMQYMFI